MITLRAFTLVELVLALGLGALLMAIMGPALLASLRSLDAWRSLVEPGHQTRLALDMLREDLSACPRPAGLRTTAFRLEDGHRLSFTSLGSPALHPTVAITPAQEPQRLITWSVTETGDGLMRLERRSTAIDDADPASDDINDDIMLDRLATCSFSVMIATQLLSGYDSDDRDARLPLAIVLRYAPARRDGRPGQERIHHIALPQVLLDPLLAAEDGP